MKLHLWFQPQWWPCGVVGHIGNDLGKTLLLIIYACLKSSSSFYFQQMEPLSLELYMMELYFFFNFYIVSGSIYHLLANKMHQDQIQNTYFCMVALNL
jgi:hypothetical protein